MSRKQVRVTPAVVQAARLRVAVNDRQNKPTSAVTRRIADARITTKTRSTVTTDSTAPAPVAGSPG